MGHEVFVNNKPHSVKVLERNGNSFLVEVNGKTVRVKLGLAQGRSFPIEVNGDVFLLDVERAKAGWLLVKSGGIVFDVLCQPRVVKAAVVKSEPVVLGARKSVGGLAVGKGVVVAPIAGRIVLLNVSVGKKVVRGGCVCVLEAMKMQNEIVASEGGIVSEIRVREGTVVNKGDVLVIIKYMHFCSGVIVLVFCVRADSGFVIFPLRLCYENKAEFKFASHLNIFEETACVSLFCFLV
ncbi:biotin/lipoyl-binding protein [Candidatus Bathyarchaeota archaeon]|nr:biotin/lipoyl-binding protein [Candidatus Bathyarchaeota archaeon]